MEQPLSRQATAPQLLSPFSSVTLPHFQANTTTFTLLQAQLYIKNDAQYVKFSISRSVVAEGVFRAFIPQRCWESKEP